MERVWNQLDRGNVCGDWMPTERFTCISNYGSDGWTHSKNILPPRAPEDVAEREMYNWKSILKMNHKRLRAI